LDGPLSVRSDVGVRDIGFQHFAFAVHGTPKVVRLGVDLHKHLMQVPLLVRVCLHPVCSFFSYLSRKHRAKIIPPKPNGLLADVDAAFVQQILNIPKR